MQRFEREIMMIGKDGFDRLRNSHIAVFGVGGVGSFACEALARAGVGELTLTDSDCVSVTNINRQLIALSSTVGRKKTSVMRERISDINENAAVHEINKFYLPENAEEFPLDGYDYIADCIDTVSGKLSLAEHANRAGVPIISCMGTGNKLHPELLEITDIYKTSVCPLARVMRRECRARGINSLKVIYSKEEPRKPLVPAGEKPVPASISFVPSAAGLMIAGEIVRDILKI